MRHYGFLNSHSRRSHEEVELLSAAATAKPNTLQIIDQSQQEIRIKDEQSPKRSFAAEATPRLP